MVGIIKEYKDYNILLDIIDRNIKKSKEEFGLEIKSDDIELEKKVILSVLSEYNFKKVKEYDNNEYNKLYREVYRKITDRLEPQLKYYFYNTPVGETKTRYNCHLEYIMTDLFRTITK